MFPPNTAYLGKIWQPLWDTIKMSFLGSFIGAVPVSYTHLDVYKRQAPEGAGKGSAMTEREKRVQWFQEARFGMFLHWGLYAIPGRGE